MATQEERIGTLEYGLAQFRTETIKSYTEMAMELVLVKGLTENSIKRLAEMKTYQEQRFERIDTHLDGINAHIYKVEDWIGKLEERLAEHAGLLLQILQRLPEPKEGE